SFPTRRSSDLQNGRGRMTSVSSSVSTYAFNGYDASGKVLSATQTIYGQTNQSYTTTNNSYDLAGHPLVVTYPSGHTVTNTFDNSGQLTSVAGRLGDNALRTYSSGILYDAGGRMTKEQLGTGTAIYNKLLYDSRGQLSEIRVG